MKGKKGLFAFIFMVILLISTAIPAGATCSSGIKGNGTSGIYININDAPYTTFATYDYGNYAYGKEGCAWFASARVKELTGKGSTIFSGWAWYYSQYSNYGFTRGNVPRAKALACYGNHVAVVEAVNGDSITVSQGGMGGLSDAAHGYCVISTMTRAKLESQSGCGTFYGYVYLDGGSPTPPDTQPPVISDVYIKDRSATGYTVHCIVTDNMGFGYVRFPTWSINNGQDDLMWGDPGEIAGTGWELNYRVNISDHNNETNCQYVTHIYAYDAAGNVTSVSAGEVFVDATAPTITDVKITDVSEEGYTVTCTVSDNDMIDKVLFPTWTSKDGQDDLQQPWNTIDTYRGEISNGKATFRVNRSDHNNEKGLYITHIYAYDACGNVSKDTGSARYVFEEVHTHNYTKSVTKKATCTEKGVFTYTCIDCGDNYTEEIQPTGHVGNKIVKNQKAATTKEEGYTGDVYCADCGNLLSTGKVIAKLSEGEKPSVTKIPESPEHHKSHVGQPFVVNGLKYKVTKDDTSGREVRVTSMVTDTDTLNIPATVTNSRWKESFKVTSIKAKAFKNKSFAKAVIGNNVTKIGPNAFYHCWYLQKVVIGKSVKSIGVRAFYKCDYLKKVNIKSNVMTIVKKNAFKRLYWKAVIKVPKGKKQAYKGLLKGKIDRGTKVK